MVQGHVTNNATGRPTCASFGDIMVVELLDTTDDDDPHRLTAEEHREKKGLGCSLEPIPFIPNTLVAQSLSLETLR